MKYIKLKLLQNLILDITYIIKSKWDNIDKYGNFSYSHITSTWYCTSYGYKISKIYNKSIKYVYTQSFDDYIEYLPVDVFKCMTTLLEDLICNTEEFDDEIKSDICYYIFHYRSIIIKNAC